MNDCVDASGDSAASMALRNDRTETFFRNNPAATTVPYAGTRQNSIHKQVTLPPNSSAVLSKTAFTLFQTLQDLRSDIAECGKPDKLHQLLVTTKECLDAIKKVQDIAAQLP